MATTKWIPVQEGEVIKPGDEVFDGQFWRMVKAYDFKPAVVQTGQQVRRMITLGGTSWWERDAFECNE